MQQKKKRIVAHTRSHAPVAITTGGWYPIFRLVIGPLLIALLCFLIVFGIHETRQTLFTDLPYGTLLQATFATMLRLVVAYLLATLFAYPLAILVYRRPKLRTFLLPLFDILESVPVLVFFPFVILIFIHTGFAEGAAIFILFLNMLWNIVFNLIGGFSLIPKDINEAASLFGVKGRQYLYHVLIPASLPALITGSLLAWAEGWNMIIVAEVLHTYIPGGTSANDLFGIGSVLVNAAQAGQTPLFLAAMVLIIIVIAVLNVFLWQRLLRYAEKFKFE